MLITAIGDLHGFLPDTPECDVLVIPGDVCPVIDHSIPRQKLWLSGEFRPWLERQPAKHIIGIAGNHDFVFQEDSLVGQSLPWLYLDNESVVIDGVHFWGSPLSSWFGKWAFMKHENELVEIYATIPGDVDVLITHGPAFGACDLAQRRVNAGSQSLRERIVTLRPALQLTGHIHEAYGLTSIGPTIVGNASCVNEHYELVNDPLRFTYENGAVQLF